MAFASENSARSLVTSSSISYALNPAKWGQRGQSTSNDFRFASPTCFLQHLLIQNFHHGGLVRQRGHEPIVYDGNSVILDTSLYDHIRNPRCVGKGRDITANLIERDSEIGGKGA